MQSALFICGRYVLWSHNKHQISLHWTISLGRNTGLVSCELLVTHFFNQSIHSLVLCVLFFKSILLSINCWFINIELMANSTTTHAWKIIWHLCSLPDTSQSYLGAPDKPSVWGPFQRANPSKKRAQKCKNCSTKCTFNGHLFTAWELKQEDRAWLCSTVENVCVEQFKFYTVNFILLCTYDTYYKEV